MMGSEWLYGAIALLVGLHILTMLYAFRRRGEPASAGVQTDATRSPSGNTADADVVRCRHCGAHNQSGYQFCKQCVADLSSGGPAGEFANSETTY